MIQSAIWLFLKHNACRPQKRSIDQLRVKHCKANRQILQLCHFLVQHMRLNIMLSKVLVHSANESFHRQQQRQNFHGNFLSTFKLNFPVSACGKTLSLPELRVVNMFSVEYSCLTRKLHVILVFKNVTATKILANFGIDQ